MTSAGPADNTDNHRQNGSAGTQNGCPLHCSSFRMIRIAGIDKYQGFEYDTEQIDYTITRRVSMELRKEEQGELINCLLDMGQLLLDCGAEISRVEDTLSRMAGAYGSKHADVFVITSIISISIEFSSKDVLTETRRIFSSSGTDFYRLEKLNSISRSCCASPMPIAELKRALEDVAHGRKPIAVVLVGSALAAGGFAMFFGGGMWDGISAAIFGLLICLVQRRLASTKLSTVGGNLLLSFVTGLCVGIICKIIPVLNMDKILIGDIMLMIPGLAMTNSIRNMLGGDTISGVVRLIESLIWAGALAGGFMTAFMIINLLA